MLLIWPIRVLVITVRQYRNHADETHQLHHVSRIAQISDLLLIGLRYWVSPEIYYMFEIYLDRDISKARTFLLENTMTSLMGHINADTSDLHIEDKHCFNAAMSARGFPVIEDLGLATQGRIVDANGNALKLPGCDLIAKPNIGLEGRGLIRFKWLGNYQYQSSTGTLYSTEQLQQLLVKLSHRETYLIQPRMINHPAIDDLANGQFCTCRIITGMSSTGQTEVVTAVFKMPTGDAIADNFGAGGLASAIDLKTGKLGRAVYKQKYLIEFDKHPDTGAVITGRELPCWIDTIDLVTQAHRQVDGEFAFLGWDVGINESGPVIVETQVTFGFILCQRPARVGLCETRFSDIYAQWIDPDTLEVISNKNVSDTLSKVSGG